MRSIASRVAVSIDRVVRETSLRVAPRFVATRAPHTMATPSAVGAYRALMRARAKAFAGDARALDAAHREIRTQFERARDVDANDARAKIAAAVEAATFVRTHVVQAVREGDEGAFRMTVDAEHRDVTISRDGEGEKGCGGGGGVA